MNTTVSKVPAAAKLKVQPCILSGNPLCRLLCRPLSFSARPCLAARNCPPRCPPRRHELAFDAADRRHRGVGLEGIALKGIALQAATRAALHNATARVSAATARVSAAGELRAKGLGRCAWHP